MSLKQSLEKLQDFITKLALNMKDSGEVDKKDLYYKIRKVELSEKPLSKSYRISYETIKRPEWRLSVQELHVIETYLENNSQFNKCIHLIVENHSKEERQAKGLLFQFSKRIFQEVLEEKKQIEQNIDIFLSDLKNKPVEWEAKVFLKNLYVEEIIKVKNVTLRKPIAEDFETIITTNYENEYSEVDKVISDSILEVKTSAINETEVDSFIDHIVNILRLFKTCSVYSNKRIYILFRSIISSRFRWRIISQIKSKNFSFIQLFQI